MLVNALKYVIFSRKQTNKYGGGDILLPRPRPYPFSTPYLKMKLLLWGRPLGENLGYAYSRGVRFSVIPVLDIV